MRDVDEEWRVGRRGWVETAKSELLRPSPAPTGLLKGLVGNADRSPPSPPPARDKESGGERPRVWLL